MLIISLCFILVNAQRRPAIFNDTTLCRCYATNTACLGGSAVNTVGTCCDNSVDPIGYSFVTDIDTETCQVCPRGQFIQVARTSSLP